MKFNQAVDHLAFATSDAGHIDADRSGHDSQAGAGITSETAFAL